MAMEFGRLSDSNDPDLCLPPDDPATSRSIFTGTAGRPKVYIGCPLWQDDAIARKLCPPGLPKAQRLACYAGQFNAVELNSTGYGIDPENVKRWAAQAGPDFRFCPKVPRDITHTGNLDGVGDAYQRFCAAADLFGEKLGPALLQFAESFDASRFPWLERFLRAHARRIPLALELRHAGWFRDPGLRRDLFALCENLGVSAVVTDTPGRRDLLHQRLTCGVAFIRFSGHDMGPGDQRRLEDWADRLKLWLERGVGSVYFFTHMIPDHLSVDLAVRFIGSLDRRAGLSLPAPRVQIRAEQGDLFADA